MIPWIWIKVLNELTEHFKSGILFQTAQEKVLSQISKILAIKIQKEEKWKLARNDKRWYGLYYNCYYFKNLHIIGKGNKITI